MVRIEFSRAVWTEASPSTAVRNQSRAVSAPMSDRATMAKAERRMPVDGFTGWCGKRSSTESGGQRAAPAPPGSEAAPAVRS